MLTIKGLGQIGRYYPRIFQGLELRPNQLSLPVRPLSSGIDPALQIFQQLGGQTGGSFHFELCIKELGITKTGARSFEIDTGTLKRIKAIPDWVDKKNFRENDDLTLEQFQQIVLWRLAEPKEILLPNMLVTLQGVTQLLELICEEPSPQLYASVIKEFCKFSRKAEETWRLVSEFVGSLGKETDFTFGQLVGQNFHYASADVLRYLPRALKKMSPDFQEGFRQGFDGEGI